MPVPSNGGHGRRRSSHTHNGDISKQRLPLPPQVPTFAELGYADVDFSNWIGVITSAQVPAELAQKIQTAAYKAAATPKVHDRMEALGHEPMAAQTLPQLSQSLRAEYERNGLISCLACAAVSPA